MLYIVLPAFNEEQALPLLLKEIYKTYLGNTYQIVVIDDGSTDQTYQVLQQYKEEYRTLEIIKHEENKGLSAALFTGFNYVINKNKKLNLEDVGTSRNKEVDVVLTLDSDNTHPADRIPIMVEKIQEGADIVIASRFVKGGEQHGLGVFRRLLSWGAGKVMSIFFPIPGVRDYSCGYRAYRLPILEKGINHYQDTLMESSGFAGMVELLIKLSPFSKKIEEIPLNLHYELKCGASKMKILLTIKGYIELILKYRKATRRTLEWVEE